VNPTKTASEQGLVESVVVATAVIMRRVTNKEESLPPDEPCALRNRTTGQYWAFCDRDCLAELTAVVRLGTPTLKWIVDLPDTGTCAHCGWCGDLVHRPEVCLLHDGPCPSSRWELTLQGMAATASIAGRFSDPITDVILQTLEHVGRRHPEIDGRDLFRWALEH
jgi:hypothetical protein